MPRSKVRLEEATRATLQCGELPSQFHFRPTLEISGVGAYIWPYGKETPQRFLCVSVCVGTNLLEE
jgi:hypothetical protein